MIKRTLAHSILFIAAVAMTPVVALLLLGLAIDTVIQWANKELDQKDGITW